MAGVLEFVSFSRATVFDNSRNRFQVVGTRDLSTDWEQYNSAITIRIGTVDYVYGGPDAPGANHDDDDEPYLWRGDNTEINLVSAMVGAYSNADQATRDAIVLILDDGQLAAPSFDDPTGDAIMGTVGTAIADVTVPEANGDPTPTYAVEGSLPTGVSFDTGTRVLSFDENAIEVGSGTITIRATNSEGTADWTVDYTFVAALAAPVFADDTGTPISGTEGVAITSVTVPEATGNPTPSYAVVGSLPAGLDFDTATRVLSGTPAGAGTGTIRIRATNSQGSDDWTVDYTFASAVAAPSFADDTGDAIVGETNKAITAVTIPRATGMPTPTYSQIGTTPSGLTVTLPTSGADGSITGTPDAVGSGTIRIRATNSEGTDEWTVAYDFEDAALLLALFSATGTVHMQFRAHAGAFTRGNGQINLWASTDWTNDGTAGQVGTLEEGSAAVSGISGNTPTIARLAKWSNANRLIINTDGAGDIGSLFDDGDEPYRVTLVVETDTGHDMFTVAPESSGHGSSFVDWRQGDGDLTAAMYAMLDGLADGEEFILALHQGTASYTTPVAPSFADDTGTPIDAVVGDPIPSITVPEATGNPTPTYSAANLPPGVSFDPATRALSFDENNIVHSSGTIRITATNIEGTDEWTVAYTFRAASIAPFFADVFGDPIEVLVGETIAPITIPRAAGGNPLPTYSLVGTAPSGLTVTLPTTDSDGSITGQPDAAASGFITVRATNSDGHADWAVRYSIAAEGMKVTIMPDTSTVSSGETVTLEGEAYGDLISVDRAGGVRADVELWLLSQASDGNWILRERGGLSGLTGLSRPLSIATRGGAFFIMDRFGEDIFRITNLDTGAGAVLGTESDADLDIPQGSTFRGDVYWIIDEQNNDLWSWADVVTSPDGGVQNGTVNLNGAPRGMTVRAGSLVVLAVDGRNWQLLRIDDPSTGASTALATFSSVPAVPISGVPEAVEEYRDSLWLFTSDSELVEVTDLDGTPTLQQRADFDNADLSDPVGLTQYPKPASYAWTSDNGGTFGDAAALSTTWEAPDFASDTDVTLTLTVTEEDGTTTTAASVVISVEAADDRTPLSISGSLDGGGGTLAGELAIETKTPLEISGSLSGNGGTLAASLAIRDRLEISGSLDGGGGVLAASLVVEDIPLPPPGTQSIPNCTVSISGNDYTITPPGGVGVLIIDALTAGTDDIYFFEMSLQRSSETTEIENTFSSSGDGLSGADFTSAMETGEASVILESGGNTLTLPGPNFSGNRFSDTTDDYIFIPPASYASAYSAFLNGLTTDSLVTVTFTDQPPGLEISGSLDGDGGTLAGALRLVVDIPLEISGSLPGSGGMLAGELIGSIPQFISGSLDGAGGALAGELVRRVVTPLSLSASLAGGGGTLAGAINLVDKTPLEIAGLRIDGGGGMLAGALGIQDKNTLVLMLPALVGGGGVLSGSLTLALDTMLFLSGPRLSGAGGGLAGSLNVIDRPIISRTFLQDLFGAETDEVWLILLTISHPDLSDDIRVVNNWENISSRGDDFVGLPFDISLPIDSAENQPSARIRIDNVSREIIQHLREVNSALEVLIEVIRASAPNVVEARFAGFTLRTVDADVATISGSLSLDDITIEPFPAHSFTPANFPGLY